MGVVKQKVQKIQAVYDLIKKEKIMGSWLIAPLVACVIAWDSASKQSAKLVCHIHIAVCTVLDS